MDLHQLGLHTRFSEVQKAGFITALVLPVVLAVASCGDSPAHYWESISACYYTKAGPLFILMMLAISYHLFKTKDSLLMLAALALLGIIIFPCGDPFLDVDHNMRVGIFRLKYFVSDIYHIRFLAILSSIIFIYLLKKVLKKNLKAFIVLLLAILGMGLITWEQSVDGRIYHWTTIISEGLIFIPLGCFLVNYDK